MSHIDYFIELIAGEAAAREQRRVQRCILQARFPVLKTIDQFNWNWPTKFNRPQIQNLFHPEFIAKRANVVFISGVGRGGVRRHAGTDGGSQPGRRFG